MYAGDRKGKIKLQHEKKTKKQTKKQQSNRSKL